MEVRAVIMHAMISNCVAVMMVRSLHTRARASRLPVNVDCVLVLGAHAGPAAVSSHSGWVVRHCALRARYRREWLRESFALLFTRDAFPSPPCINAAWAKRKPYGSAVLRRVPTL